MQLDKQTVINPNTQHVMIVCGWIAISSFREAVVGLVANPEIYHVSQITKLTLSHRSPPLWINVRFFGLFLIPQKRVQKWPLIYDVLFRVVLSFGLNISWENIIVTTCPFNVPSSSCVLLPTVFVCCTLVN